MIRASKRATKIHIRTMVRVLTGRHVMCAVKHRFHGTHQRTPKHHTPATWDAGTQATPQEHVNPTRIQPTHFGSGGHISAAGRFRTALPAMFALERAPVRPRLTYVVAVAEFTGRMFRAPKSEGCCPSRWHTPESWLPFAVTGCLTHTTRLKLGSAQWRRLLVVTHGWLASAPHDRRRPCS
jgi:hypothetical protein